MDIRIKKLGLKVIHSKVPSSEQSFQNLRNQIEAKDKNISVFRPLEGWGGDVAKVAPHIFECSKLRYFNQISKLILENCGIIGRHHYRL